ncbi:hypothetical protein Q1695_008214 [Nippostrongylus brasiliensis]|nr:hypothetical protein Q1695_008214 [Nippostrongylus brasiliensis]
MHVFAVLVVAAVLPVGKSQYQSDFICKDASLQNSRESWLRLHNDCRSNVARGLVKDLSGTALPTASNMYEMIYDCALEEIAANFLKTCPTGYYTGTEMNNLASKVGVYPMDTAIKEWTERMTQYDWYGIYDSTAPPEYTQFVNVR